MPFLIALGLSGLMEPWILWCRKKLGFRRSFTSAVLTLLLASALVFGVFWLLSRLFQEAYALLDQLPTLLGGLPGLVDQVQQKAQRLCAACPQELQDVYKRQEGRRPGAELGHHCASVRLLYQAHCHLCSCFGCGNHHACVSH